jgi:hypothetical protein
MRGHDNTIVPGQSARTIETVRTPRTQDREKEFLPMGIPSVVDGVVLAPAVILALLGLWLGLGRSLVAWPMRWLIPILGACLAALPAALGLAADGGAAALLGLAGTAAAALSGALAFLVTIVLLWMFMGNLRERVAVWTGSRRTGLPARVLGALFGLAAGVVLVAIPFGVYTSLRPEAGSDPAWAQESVSVAYLRGAAEAVRSVLSEYVPSEPRRPRR